MKKKSAVIIGAGKIGRGFIAQLLHLNGWKLTLVDASAPLVDALRRAGGYTVHILGNSDKDTKIHPIEAYHIADPALHAVLAQATLVFTAVGGKNLPLIGSLLAGAYGSGGHVHGNIVTCENWKQPAQCLREEICKHLGAKAEEILKDVGITEAVIMRTVTNPPEDAPKDTLDVWGQDYWYCPIDQSRIKGDFPPLQYFELVEQFDKLLDQKIYTHNTSNAVIAYNGYHKGYRYTAEATQDPEIAALLDEVYPLLNEMLIKEFGVQRESQERLATNARRKYSDPVIQDALYRHAADPIRKLSPEDRLIAPARLCLKHGLNPDVLVRTIVAALYYDYQEDAVAQELQTLRAAKGTAYLLEHICGLQKDEPLYKLVEDALLRRGGEKA